MCGHGADENKYRNHEAEIESRRNHKGEKKKMSKVERILEYINAIRIISGTSTEDEMQTIKMLATEAHNELYDYMLLMKEESDGTLDTIS